MSVSFNLFHLDEEKMEKYVPIATQQIFVTYWLPVCEQNKLLRMTAWVTGESYTQDNIGDILNEMIVFETRLDGSFLPSEIKDFIKARLDLLRSTLNEIKGHQADFFIG